jgi:hypothetical protein
VVLVTSRTAVAHRARIPDGTLIVKLDSFNGDQIDQWIERWNQVNADNFASRNVRPLSSAVVMRHHDLACQPILLLMLAIYDADANGLSPQSEPMARVSLYERLLITFVERELLKDGLAQASTALRSRAEAELYQLAVVAYAMFNRGVQVIREDELERDFEALKILRPTPTTTDGFYLDLTSAQRTLGRFFFIHRSEARDDVVADNTIAFGLRKPTILGESFEFLHATFGEYLVARCALRIIQEAESALTEERPWHSVQLLADEALLRALLSFESFSKRIQIVTFLAELSSGLDESARRRGARTCRSLLERSAWPNTDSTYTGYKPTKADTVAQCAAYTANLVLLGIAQAGTVKLDEIVPSSAEVAADWWRSAALLWRSRLDREAWRGLSQAIKIGPAHEAKGLFIGLRSETAAAVSWSETSIRVDDYVDSTGRPVPGKTFSTIFIPGGFEDELLSSEILLDRLRLHDLDLALYLRDRFGTGIETIIGNPQRDFIPVVSGSGLEQPLASGGYIFVMLMLAAFDDDLELNRLMRIAIELIKANENIAPERTQMRAVACMLKIGERCISRLDKDAIYELSALALQVGHIEGDFAFYMLLFRFWHEFSRRLRPITEDRDSSSPEKEYSDKYQDLGIDIFARLDPLHAIDATPREMIELIIDIEDAGSLIEMTAIGFGTLSDWLLRFDIASMSFEDPRLAARIIRVAVDRGAEHWLHEACIPNMAAFSNEAFQLIPSSYIRILQTILPDYRESSPDDWENLRARMSARWNSMR